MVFVSKIKIPKLDYDSKEILSLYEISEIDPFKGELIVETVNFPDYQTRIFKRNNTIKFENKVHEIITGYEYMANLPFSHQHFQEIDLNWCLFHVKSLERQIRQNNFYKNLMNA